ncbi:MAG: TlpA disulfide reductase family protein [Betaproteobacteria bacterium]
MTDTPSSPAPSESGKTSRRWLLSGVAALAVIGGAAVAWRRQAPPAKPQTGDGQASGLWSLQLSTPQGSPLALAGLRGRPLLVNFWATWCPPCVDELPLLSSFYQQNQVKGWQVLGIAVDQTDAVNRFLARSPVSFTVAMAGMAGLELSRSLGNLSGGLPFTVVLTSAGEVAQRKMGRITEAELAAWSVLT